VNAAWLRVLRASKCYRAVKGTAVSEKELRNLGYLAPYDTDRTYLFSTFSFLSPFGLSYLQGDVGGR
jgi:hypothetical protein